MTFPLKVQLLIEYCEKNNVFAELLTLVSHKNPRKFAEFAGSLQKSTPVPQVQADQLKLPGPPIPVSVPQFDADPTSRPPARILVVEDDPMWQAILQDCLIEAGYLVELATTFNEAREKLQDSQFKPVTIDASLQPKTERHESILLLDYIRSRLGTTLPVIVVSGEIDRRDPIRVFKKLSVANVLLKGDFDYGEFNQAVREALQLSEGK